MRLAGREKAFTQNMNASERAKRLVPKLRELEAQILVQATVAKTDAARELLELEALHVSEAASLLHVLEVEQWRQREATKHFLQGRMERHELRGVTESWNGDASRKLQQEQ